MERRHVLRVRGHHAGGFGRVGRRIRRGQLARCSDQTQPRWDERHIELPTGDGDVAIRVAHRHDGERRAQPRRMLRSGEDLVDRAVRGAVQPDAAVRPRALQRRRPLRQLVAVALLARAERRPRTFRAAGPAHVGDHLDVPALHEVIIFEVQPGRELVVRSLREKNREPAGNRGAARVRGVYDIGEQRHTVAHLDRDIALDCNLGVLRRTCGPRGGSPGRRKRRNDQSNEEGGYFSSHGLLPSTSGAGNPPGTPAR